MLLAGEERSSDFYQSSRFKSHILTASPIKVLESWTTFQKLDQGSVAIKLSYETWDQHEDKWANHMFQNYPHGAAKESEISNPCLHRTWIFYVLEMRALIRKNLRRDFCIPKKQVMENLFKGDNKAKYRVFLAYLDIFAHKSFIWKSCLRNHFEFELVSQRAIGHRQFKRPCKQTLIYIWKEIFVEYE